MPHQEEKRANSRDENNIVQEFVSLPRPVGLKKHLLLEFINVLQVWKCMEVLM
jgi:hypothetical protein